MGGISGLVNHVVAPLSRRVRLLARRAIVRLVYDDPKMQEVQLAIMAGEVRDRLERWEDYGLTSHPHPGAEALALALGGSAAHTVAVRVADRRYRLTGLAAGEVALYDDQGQVIHLKRNKEILVHGCDKLTAHVAVETAITCPLVRLAASTKVRMETPLLEVTGEIKDRCDSTGRSMAEMRTTYDSHTHPENDNGGPTGQPNQAMG